MAFLTSFEESDPELTWADTIDTEDGRPRSEGATLRTHRARGGFLGAHALRYHGLHRTDGPAYVVNKLFRVELEVCPDTELSYTIFPEFEDGDPRNLATFVAVDLAFADGTYLSELGATDHLGFELSPQAQGKSLSLYPDQWNRRAAWIGAVAAGKTITRILLGYRAPEGPGRFAGWLDDLAIGPRLEPAPRRPSEHVLTTRGTNSTRKYSRGNTFPATAVPNGFNFWTPVTNARVTNWFYQYARPELSAFGVSHQPSPWIGDRQTFHVMPSAAQRLRPGRRALTFKHANEIAHPHHYGVEFDNGIRVDLAPTDHAAIIRFTFPDEHAALIFDNVNRRGGLTLDPHTGTVTGYSDVRSGLSVGAGRMFVHATVDQPVTDAGTWWWRRVAGYLRFAGPTEVTLRIATSLISPEQARRNLELEIAGDDTFETVRDRAREQWDELLGRIEVEGATEDQLTTLYSCLYRLFLYPNHGHENTGTAERPTWYYASPFAPRSGADTAKTAMARLVPGTISVNNGFWDTYRTCWPAYALLAPARCGELIDGFVQHYRDGGWISRWSAPGYANLMTGTSSDVAFADAFLKGVTNFDVRAAYDAALRNATAVPPNDSVGRKGLARSTFLHYTPLSTPDGLSWTLEGCVNDFGIANLAEALGEADPAAWLRDRALHYVNLFDAETGFFQGRDADHRFRRTPVDYDPTVWGYDYVETNGWNTAFSVPHDGRGLANLHGGPEALAAKLDSFFATPETGRRKGSYRTTIHEMLEARDVRMGQYGHSNQPSHHVIYQYAFSSTPWKIAEKVREVLARCYSGSEIGQGYPGDEDNGEMSAWWLFAALGFYPLAVGSPYYILGVPLFRKAVLHLENGSTLVINSTSGRYVRNVSLNGKPYDRLWISHDELTAGTVLDFELGPEPSAWTTGEPPPSLTQGTEIPLPLHDITGSRAGTATWNGGDAGAVFDDSGRDVTFEVATPWIRFSLRDSRATVRRYTITSGTRQGDPKSWVLEGSNDTRTWLPLDERTGEEFRWRRHTRAFTVTHPAEYAHHRLRVTENTGGRTLTLAGLELLA